MESKIVQNMEVTPLKCWPQVRKRFDEESLVGLIQSVKESGILQPLLVRREGSAFVCLDGERRLRAAKRAGLTRVPVIVDDRELGEVEVTLRQLVVNTQRQGLTAMERARAYHLLIEKSRWTVAEVARRTGYSEGTVSRLVKLLTLPAEVIERVESGELPASTAYQIAIAGDAEAQVRLANDAADGSLTRDAVVERKRPARTRRTSRRSRDTRPQVVIPLGDNRSITIAGPDLSVHSVINWLQDLLNRFRGLEPQDMDLADAIKALAVQNA